MLMSQCFGGSFANVIFPRRRRPHRQRPVVRLLRLHRGSPGVRLLPGEPRPRRRRPLVSLLRGARRRSAACPRRERRVLVSDDSPDVPNTTSDFYLQQLLDRRRQAPGQAVHRGRRRLHRRGVPRPRPLGAGDPPARSHRLDLRHVQPALARRARAADPDPAPGQRPAAHLRRPLARGARCAQAAELRALRRRQPEWKERLAPKAIADLDPTPAREQLGDELPAALGAFTPHDTRHQRPPGAAARRAAKQPSQAAYRMEVRLGVVLRMRAILDQIAGRVYLADHGTPAERDTYAALLACEDVNFVAEPSVATAAAMEPPASFPPLDDDRRVVRSGDAGVDGHPVQAAHRRPAHASEQRTAGAVTVMTVYPGLAGEPRPASRSATSSSARPRRRSRSRTRCASGRCGARSASRRRSRSRATARSGRSCCKPEPYPIKMPELPGPPKVGSVAPPLTKVERLPRRRHARRRQAAPALLLGDVVRAVQVLAARGDGVRQGARASR